VLARLRAHERELRDAGILRLAVCGSTARDEAGANSDVDLVTDFDKARLTLVDLRRRLR
jgi:predicted nucleotidyltransferase